MGTILTIILTIVKWCIIGDIVDEMFTDTFDGWKNVLENLKEAWF